MPIENPKTYFVGKRVLVDKTMPNPYSCQHGVYKVIKEEQDMNDNIGVYRIELEREGDSLHQWNRTKYVKVL